MIVHAFSYVPEPLCSRPLQAHSLYVVTLGEILWDMFPAGPRFGGAPANFAHHAASLGADVAIVSGVGNGTGAPQLAMGSTTGSLWTSADEGERWTRVSADLPPIYALHWVG